MERLSLRIRIFITVLFLIVLTSVLIVFVTVKQFKSQSQRDYQRRFETKELAARKNINHELGRTIFPVSEQFLPFIFRDRIYEIASVHAMKMSVFNLKGQLQINSSTAWYDTPNYIIAPGILNSLKQNQSFQYSKVLGSGKINQTAYSYIEANDGTKLGVLKIEYLQDNTIYEAELQSFLNRLYMVYVFMFIVAVLVAYFLTNYITKSLLEISEKFYDVELKKKNTKIALTNIVAELEPLVKAYNQMIDELEYSAKQLAKGERENAWREMAKQVAHEIKNPLTPMRLTVQSFQRNFNPADEDVYERVNDYSEMLIQQIDVMSAIATSFSDFAQMPAKEIGLIDVGQVIKSTLDVFSSEPISFISPNYSINLMVDKNQLSRVVTNLVKNSIQACENVQNPTIEVVVKDLQDFITIEVKDNGIGISKEMSDLIFEPKFTTKSSGMGLGLPMVKNIIENFGGSINFKSTENIGTVFTIHLPKSNEL